MKKGFTISMAAVLAASSITPAIVVAAPNDDHMVAKKDKKKDEEEKVFVEKIKVEKLTLDQAIQYGLNSSYSLLELDYTIENLRLQERIYDDQLDVAESSYNASVKEIAELTKYLEGVTKDTAKINITEEVAKLNNSLKDLKIDPSQFAPDSSGNPVSVDPNERLNQQLDYLTAFLTNALQYVEKNEKEQEIQEKKQRLATLKNSIGTLYFQVKQLENTVDNLDIQQTKAFNNRIQAREQMKLPIMSKYISLVITEEQIDFMKLTLETQKSQLNAKKARLDLGLMSQKDYEKATREIADLETQIDQLEKQLKNDKATFAATIGITYDEDYELEKPELGELTLVKQKTSTEELIKNSFDMVNARTELRIKEDALDDYEDDDNRTKEGEKMAENEVEVAKLKMESTQVELESAIKNTFYQVQKQYEAMKEAEKDLEEAKADNADLQVYFDLGLLSKQDYDAANIQVKQAEFTYNTAKYQYYLLTQQVELMEKGVIVKN